MPEIESGPLFGFLGVVFAAIIAGYFTLRSKRPDAEANLITAMQKRQDKQDRRMDHIEATNRLLANYAGVLRTHIDQGLGPPAPPWPPDLLRLLNGPSNPEDDDT